MFFNKAVKLKLSAIYLKRIMKNRNKIVNFIQFALQELLLFYLNYNSWNTIKLLKLAYTTPFPGMYCYYRNLFARIYFNIQILFLVKL